MKFLLVPAAALAVVASADIRKADIGLERAARDIGTIYAAPSTLTANEAATEEFAGRVNGGYLDRILSNSKGVLF